MLDIFKARLKAKSKTAGANLSQDRINALADRLHKKFPELSEEAAHDDKIDDYYDSDELKAIAKQDDRVRTAESKKKDDDEAGDAADEKSKADDTKGKSKSDSEIPEWFKPFATQLQQQQQEKKQQSIEQKIAGHEKLKGIDPKLYARWQKPEKDEDIDAFADEVSQTYGHLIKEELSEPFRPGITRLPEAGKNKKVDADLVNFAKHKNEASKVVPEKKAIISNQ